ncbi:MAG: Imm1 family immunity protein [Actinomycetota bacterium]|nr:Imm1 family immunity protein [Actinomycetota bacterium]
MVELKVWYEQPDTTTGDPAVLIRTADELNSFINRVLDETKTHRCSAMIQAVIADGPRLPILQVGLGQTKGFIGYSAKDGGWTKGDGDPSQVVEYVYMGSLSEVPADVEVSIEQVRQGLREFMESGECPSVIHVAK